MKYFCCSNFLLCVFFSWLRVSDLILFFILFEAFAFSKLFTSDLLWKLCLLFLLCIANLGYVHWLPCCSSCLQSWGTAEYAESTKDDFCAMASPANDQDLLRDPLKGVLANPHKAFPIEFTLERTQLKVVPERKWVCSPSVLAGELKQSVSFHLFTCLLKVHKDLIKNFFDKVCMVLHLT